MDTHNTTTQMNNSTFLQNVSKHSTDLSTNSLSHEVQYSHVVLLVVILLGLPGNFLVIAVYIGRMTTSTSVYMFALAVADTTICICAIAITFAFAHTLTTIVFISILSTTTTFSMFLLVFVSIERLIAVRRPHTFNMNPRRAKIYLIVFLSCAVLFTIMTVFARFMKFTMFGDILKISVLIVSALIMVTCYALIGLTLLKTAVTSRNKINGINMGVMTQNTCPPTVFRTCSNMRNDVTQSTSANAIAKLKAKQAKHLKSIYLLFVITVVFVTCWLPMWKSSIGVNVSKDVTRIYVINSVVNPFIYGVASAMFREDVRQFYRQTRTKLSACYT